MSKRKIMQVTGAVSIYRDVENDEYIVRLDRDPKSDYFTNDKEDAFDTAYEMAAQWLITYYERQNHALFQARNEAANARDDKTRQVWTRVASTIRLMPEARVQKMIQKGLSARKMVGQRFLSGKFGEVRVLDCDTDSGALVWVVEVANPDTAHMLPRTALKALNGEG